jgi:hypothetical protein
MHMHYTTPITKRQPDFRNLRPRIRTTHIYSEKYNVAKSIYVISQCDRRKCREKDIQQKKKEIKERRRRYLRRSLQKRERIYREPEWNVIP